VAEGAAVRPADDLGDDKMIVIGFLCFLSGVWAGYWMAKHPL